MQNFYPKYLLSWRKSLLRTHFILSQNFFSSRWTYSLKFFFSFQFDICDIHQVWCAAGSNHNEHWKCGILWLQLTLKWNQTRIRWKRNKLLHIFSNSKNSTDFVIYCKVNVIWKNFYTEKWTISSTKFWTYQTHINAT